MISSLCFALGLVIGALAQPLLLPIVRKKIPALARLEAALPVPVMVTSSIEARVDATIADLEEQIRNRVDVERNTIRRAQLLEIRG